MAKGRAWFHHCVLEPGIHYTGGLKHHSHVTNHSYRFLLIFMLIQVNHCRINLNCEVLQLWEIDFGRFGIPVIARQCKQQIYNAYALNGYCFDNS